MLNPKEHVLDYVDDYLHDVLSPEDAQAVEEHCERCPICRAGIDEARKRFEALKSVAHSEASEQLVQQTLENIDMVTTTRQRRWTYFSRTVLLATAASVLIIGGLNLHYYRMTPSPYELRLLGQNELLAGANAALRVAVFDHRTRQPVSGIPVTLTLLNRQTNDTVTLASFTTGDKGADSPQLTLPDWKDGQYELRVTAKTGIAAESLTRPIELKRAWKLMLGTDKPVYQPGQTIHLRSLGLRRPDLKPVTGEQVVFSITDPKGNVIFRQPDVTSKFGIASADCPLATEIIEGPYEIECRVGDTTSTRTVEVQRYVLPKFKVAVTLDKPFYQPGQQVSGTIQSDYFFGKPVAGAAVAIEVRAADVSSFEIASIQEKSDDTGRASFRFALPDRLVGREQDAGNARFQLAVKVTDTAGQTHSTGVSRIVTAEPIQLEIIPEAGTLVKGLPNTIYVYASYADGRPAKVRLVVHGINDEVETSDLGVASFELTPKDNNVGLTVKATDAAGQIGRRHVQLTCGTVAGDFLVRTDKAVYDGGDTLTINAQGSGVEPVFVDLIKDGQTMLTQTIELSGGKGQAQVDLPPDLFGTIRLVAYRFGEAGLAVRKSRMLFVRQAGQLQVKATLDSDEYRPGAKATLRLTLSDEHGKPAPGAIGLAAVDEAVYSVLNQSSGMERVFFLLEQELLEPVYAIYNWSPDLPGPPGPIPLAERTRFEQALFSLTAESAGGQNAMPAGFVAAHGDDGASDVVVRQWDEMAFDAPAMPYEEGTDVSSLYTLVANSFPEKLADIRAQRRNGLASVVIAWFSLAGALVLVGLAAFAVYRPRAFVISAAIFLGVTFLIAPVCLLAFAWFAIGSKADVAATRMFAEDAPMAAMDFGGVTGAKMNMLMEVPSEGIPTADDPSSVGGSDAASPPRVRQWFPETLLWRPELITDDAGVATLEIDLADSITTWRLSASAVSAEGRLGAGEFPLKVFQSFFVDLDLPVALTRNDEVSVPIVVYNYLDKPQTVELTVENGDWFARLNVGQASSLPDLTNDQAGWKPTPLKLDLAPGEVRSLSYPIKVLKVGNHQLQVTATGGGVADAIKRQIEVVPDGRRVEEVASGTLGEPVEMTLDVPEGVIDGSLRTIVKLHPSSFSQLLEGLDAIFQMPSGCFEQTSSTTYPNILALDYLRRTGKSVPAVEAKARQYIHVGYQRLVSFEVRGGGFDWFGNPPANRTLTAYGLMEFDDMARVHDVDPNLIDRTRAWLLGQRAADGSWPAEIGMLNDGLAGSVQRGDVNLSSTAYIAWAVFGNGKASSEAAPTLDYLLAHRPDSINDPYTLAIVASAIASIDKNNAALDAYLNRLDSLKQTDAEGKLVWWNQPEGGQTMFYGSGQSGDIETTAMAALALLEANRNPATTRKALTWLIQQKDASGTWHSTQATVLALKALVAGTGKSLGDEKERHIEIALGGEVIRKITIPADQADVMQQIDLSDMVTNSGQYRLSLAERTDSGTGYQIAFRYHVPVDPAAEKPAEPLSIDIVYDRQRLNVDDTVTAVATVTNNMPQTAPMVILDLPIPGGFKIEPGELDELKGSSIIAKYQITARKAIVYLRALAPGEKLELRYRLKATMPVKVAVPPAQVYEYYTPETRGTGGAAVLEATSEA